MRNKLHLGVYGVLIRDEKILLIKKGRGPYTGLLDLPGGRLEHGEKIEEGLKREIEEETGLQAGEITLLQNVSTQVDFTYEGEDISMYHVGLLYRVAAVEGELVQEMNEEDSLGADWHALADLQKETLSPFAKIAVQGARGA